MTKRSSWGPQHATNHRQAAAVTRLPARGAHLQVALCTLPSECHRCANPLFKDS